MKCKNIILLIYLSIIYCYSYSQSSPVTTGGDITIGALNISYSIGQVVFHSKEEQGVFLNEGLQNPLELYILEILKDSNSKDCILVFPNPTTNSIQVTLENMPDANFLVSIFDTKGVCIESIHIMEETTIISLSSYKNSIYFLVFYKNLVMMKSFKLIKQ